MIITSVFLQDIGVFKGENLFDLAPINGYTADTQQPITLIIGKNGAGKTTLFRALAIALFGRRAFGKLSHKKYEEMIFELRRDATATGGHPEQPVDIWSLGASFVFVQSGAEQQIAIRRAWCLKRGCLSESVNILCNGEALDLPQDETEQWLAELIAPEFAEICLFDAEQLGRLMEALTSESTLRAVLNRVTGLHLVNALDDDLERYLIAAAGPSLGAEVGHEINELDQVIASLGSELEKLQEARVVLTAEIAALEAKTKQHEIQQRQAEARKSEGTILAEQLTQLRERRDSRSSEASEIAAGLLPFVFSRASNSLLCERLRAEENAQQARLSDQRIQALTAEILAGIQQDKQLDSTTVHNFLKRVECIIFQRLHESLGANNKARSEIHDFSVGEFVQLRGWLEEVKTLPVLIKRLAEEIADIDRHMLQITERLEKNAAKNEAHVRLDMRSHRQTLTTSKTRIDRLQEQILDIEHQINSLKHQRLSLIDRILAAQAESTKSQLAAKSRIALKAYAHALTLEYVERLERETLNMLTALARKENFVSDIRFDAERLTLHLVDGDGRPIAITRLSNGERQLLALCLLRALRKLAPASLPLIIDMPFARLDEEHRSSFINKFVPDVSEQVILMVMDSEIPKENSRPLQERVARTVALEYLDGTRSTAARVDLADGAGLSAGTTLTRS